MRLAAWTKELQGEAWLEVSNRCWTQVSGMLIDIILGLQDETLEVYKYTKTAAMLDPGWYSCLDQLSDFALDTLDHKNLSHGDETIPDDIMEMYILPACFGKCWPHEGDNMALRY